MAACLACPRDVCSHGLIVASDFTDRLSMEKTRTSRRLKRLLRYCWKPLSILTLDQKNTISLCDLHRFSSHKRTQFVSRVCIAFVDELNELEFNKSQTRCYRLGFYCQGLVLRNSTDSSPQEQQCRCRGVYFKL